MLSEVVENDYTGHEEIWAGYIMGEINFGKWVTFIPGVRYDYTYMKYTGYGSNAVKSSSGSGNEQFDYWPLEDSQSFAYFLPQIHLKIMPAEWMDIRLAYTETLSRPDYNLLVPQTLVYPNTMAVTYSRTNLKPAKSQNYDLTLSFYPNNWGLFTVSPFYKNIKNFIYTRKAQILAGTDTDATNFGVDPTLNGATVTYPLNNPTDASIFGIELDAQVQFHQMDNFLKGFVLTANFTIMDSRMKYHTTALSRATNPDYGKVPGASPFVQVNTDTYYEDRLIDQPTYLFNASLGYDYKRFSVRLSCNYQDGVLVTAQQRSDAADKEITKPFMKLDAQLKYTINRHVSLYASWSNINCAVDRRVRYITGYPVRTEYYGTCAYIGVKYNIF